MKRILGLLAFVLLASVPAFAAYGGIGGRILDASGQPLSGVPVAIFRLPLQEGEVAASTLTTNRNGYFAKIGIENGRYLVRADVNGGAVACAIDDVYGGWNTHMVLRVREDGVQCSGPRVHAAMVNPAMTADVYIIR